MAWKVLKAKQFKNVDKVKSEKNSKALYELKAKWVEEKLKGKTMPWHPLQPVHYRVFSTIQSIELFHCDPARP